jgi:hypothetical protein
VRSMVVILCNSSLAKRRGPCGYPHTYAFSLYINKMLVKRQIVTAITLHSQKPAYGEKVMSRSLSPIAGKVPSHLRDRRRLAISNWTVDGLQTRSGRGGGLWHNSRDCRGGIRPSFTFGSSIRRLCSGFSDRGTFSYRLKRISEVSLGPALLTGVQGDEGPFGLREMAVCQSTRPPTGRACHA